MNDDPASALPELVLGVFVCVLVLKWETLEVKTHDLLIIIN